MSLLVIADVWWYLKLGIATHFKPEVCGDSLFLLGLSALHVIQRTMVPFGGFHSGLIFPGIYFSLSAAALQTHGSPKLLRSPPRFLASTLSHFPQSLFQTLSTVLTCFLSPRMAMPPTGGVNRSCWGARAEHGYQTVCFRHSGWTECGCRVTELMKQ